MPYQDFPTADGDMIIAVGNDGQFARLSAAAGHPEWATSPLFATNQDRVMNREAFVAAFSAVSVTRTTAAWVALLEGAGVPCGPINTLADVFADPQIVARGMAMSMPHGSGVDARLVSSPMRLSATPVEYTRAPPMLGEHTHDVLARRLGLDDAAIAALKDEGVI